jgi:hypothetical protein
MTYRARCKGRPLEQQRKRARRKRKYPISLFDQCAADVCYFGPYADALAAAGPLVLRGIKFHSAVLLFGHDGTVLEHWESDQPGFQGLKRVETE